MIEIHLTPGDIGDALLMRRLAAAMLALAGAESVGQTMGTHIFVDIDGKVAQTSTDPANRRTVGETIASEDCPDVGVDPEPSAAQVFAGAGHAEPDPSPAQVFGSGNVAAVSGSAYSPSHATNGVSSTNASMASTTASTATSGAVSGDTGNAPGATFPTPSGTPAAPNNGAATAGAAMIDSRGLPWDGRIHAGTKTTNKDGSWKKKPNVDPALVAQVENELRALMAIPPQAGNVPVPPPPTTAAPAPATIPPPPAGATSGNAGTPSPPASQQTTPGGVASNPAPVSGFAQFLPRVTGAIAAGSLTQEQVAAALAAVGLMALPQLAVRQDLLPAVSAVLFPAG